MRPFEVSPALEPLRDVYLSADAILVAAREGDRDARYAMARLWLSEGIPYSFKARPGLYESLRRWLARRLDVHAKEITLVGSGRQGFCLSPGADLRRPFGEHSDLDLTVVSESLFQRMQADFVRWEGDFAAGSVAARRKRQRALWEANRKSVPRGLARGFIDPHKIPMLDRYPEAQMIGQVMYEAHEKLKVTRDAPAVRKLSVRIYRDWDSFVRQMAINLESAAAIEAEN
ncbi:MAG: hypothetical protein A2W03_15075 [Candidatus Aminicenantes bacterium RBG_16_63_16]|nr:MAG: hypothetical protein A2W03_15075 [Candidatus Aminicenantes bacterium RBG_16_63_16]